MTPALVCGKHLLDLDHGLLRDITFSQHSAGVGWLSDSLGVSDAPRVPPDRPRSGIGKDRPDYIVVTGEWEVGRICETRGGSDGPMTRADRVATLEEAKARFQKNWDAWKAWAKLEEMP